MQLCSAVGRQALKSRRGWRDQGGHKVSLSVVRGIRLRSRLFLLLMFLACSGMTNAARASVLSVSLAVTEDPNDPTNNTFDVNALNWTMWDSQLFTLDTFGSLDAIFLPGTLPAVTLDGSYLDIFAQNTITMGGFSFAVGNYTATLIGGNAVSYAFGAASSNGNVPYDQSLWRATFTPTSSGDDGGDDDIGDDGEGGPAVTGTFDLSYGEVPEPSSLVLILCAAPLVIWGSWRRKSGE